MSSPHAPQVGLALQREEPDATDLANNHRNIRPFSASDPHGGDLLTVLVHFGRHFDALVPKESSTKLDGLDSNAAGRERLNTYVVASVGTFAISSNCVRCRRGDNAKTTDTLTPSVEGRVLYEQTCSPYAATRVVEGSSSPSWNEVLAIPLPTGWLNTSQLTPDLGDEAGVIAVGTSLALKLELVERGASHQEDFLLGTCVLPLAKTGCQLQQTRFALVFPSADPKSSLDLASPATSVASSIYVSLYATSRVSTTSVLDQVEITVESFTPVVATGSEDEEPLDCTNLAVLINLHPGGRTSDSVEKYEELENHFAFLQDGQTFPEPNAAIVNVSKADSKLVGVTPSGSSVTGSSSGVYEWFFPLCFAVPAQGTCNHDFSVATVNIALFKTSSVPHRLVGHGLLQISSTTAQKVKKDGSSFRHTVIPITLHGDSSRVLGHTGLRLRWWNAAAWRTFIHDIPARRIVCTNRWKRSPRLTIAWMGALLRGLNRHPVASICDVGGVSSVLAEIIAQPSFDEETMLKPQQVQQQHRNIVPQSSSKNTDDTIELLREQLAHSQAEGTAQRLQIQRLQNELDTRLAAIKTCGLEIVTLRREARQNDVQLQKLKEEVEIAQRREQQQVAELLTSTNSNGSAFSTSRDHQAASQRFTLLATKYKELDHEHQAVKQQLADAQRSLGLCTDLETRHTKLQEAHLVQAALVQRLQRDKQHATALKKAVRIQEKVIRQFEQTVAKQSTEIAERPLRSQHAPVTEQLEIAGSSETRETLLRVRVQVLEQQLQTNAREAAAEMSALRMRILELETAESRRTGK